MKNRAAVAVAFLLAVGLALSVFALVVVVAADRRFGLAVPYALMLPALVVTAVTAMALLLRRARRTDVMADITTPAQAPAPAPRLRPRPPWHAKEGYVFMQVKRRTSREERIA